MSRFVALSIERLILVAGGILLLAMMIQVSVDVALRTGLGTAIPTTAELVSRYYMVAVSFLPVALVELRRRHIEATVFVDMAPPMAGAWIVYMGFIASFALYAVLTWSTGLEAMRRTASGAYVEVGTRQLLVWPSYWILPVSFFLMCVVLLFRILSGPAALADERKPGAEGRPDDV